METKGLMKVTGSHVDCKRDDISNAVQDRHVAITDH